MQTLDQLNDIDADPDIIRAAKAMIRTYGARATARALSRAELLLHEGDLDAHTRWRRVSDVAQLLLMRAREAAGLASGAVPSSA